LTPPLKSPSALISLRKIGIGKSSFASNRDPHPGSGFTQVINEMLQPWKGSQLDAISHGELDSHFHARSPGGRRSASTFTQMLNRSQSFRIIPKAPCVVYANGTFYEPQGFAVRPDGSIAQLTCSIGWRMRQRMQKAATHP